VVGKELLRNKIISGAVKVEGSCKEAAKEEV
jgi:hypothetical protein